MSKKWIWFVASVGLLGGCSAANPGDPGPTDVQEIPITGTVFTIVFENHSTGDVLNDSNPFFQSLATRYAVGDAYLANVHPSLPNYLLMTSGDTGGVGDDGPPSAHSIDGNENLADQLDAAHVPWRAYMEDMGEPCRMEDSGDYAVKHNPFLYYTSLTNDRARCEEHVVDMDQHLAEDLAADEYRYMWITPNLCNDMHDCPVSVSEAWLEEVLPMIVHSPGYQNGGAIFIMWDEGSGDATYATSYLFGRPQNIPFILMSNLLPQNGYHSNITYGHDSYLATMEDLFHMPRLPTTEESTSMSDFFTGVAAQPLNPEPVVVDPPASEASPPPNQLTSPDTSGN